MLFTDDFVTTEGLEFEKDLMDWAQENWNILLSKHPHEVQKYGICIIQTIYRTDDVYTSVLTKNGGDVSMKPSDPMDMSWRYLPYTGWIHTITQVFYRVKIFSIAF